VELYQRTGPFATSYGTKRAIDGLSLKVSLNSRKLIRRLL
jgi:hypothetical protein